MENLLIDYKKQLDEFLLRFLQEQKPHLSQINGWGNDVIDRLAVFVTAGKDIRGSLLLFSAQAFGLPLSEDVLKAAVAIELTHSGLLIHDDIMDRDLLRREQKTMYVQYSELGKKLGHRDAAHFGLSMAVCVADVCFFLADKIISTLAVDRETLQQIVRLLANEFISVSVAQMQDVAQTTDNLDSVLRLYRYKTSRYTFSLPLVGGAVLARQAPNVIKKLERLGEALGVLYQLKDDLLAIGATPQQIGKSVGADIRERKKTLPVLLAREYATAQDKQELKQISAGRTVTVKDLRKLARILQSPGVQEKINHLIQDHKRSATDIIKRLPISPVNRRRLIWLRDYVVWRQK